jgi:glycosyltransferase involved in cell wall biosynthesis
MKIIITNASLLWGGNENWVFTIAKLLKGRHHTVKLILKEGSEVSERAARLGIPVISVSRFGGDFELPNLLHLYRIFLRERPDVVILTHWKDYWVCGLTSWLAKVPVRLLRLSILRRVQDNLKYRLIYRHFVNRVVVNSREVELSTRASAKWLEDTTIHVLYNGIAVPDPHSSWIHQERAKELRKEWEIPDDAFVFGACVNFFYRKRLDLIISALADLRDELPNAHVFLAGKGEVQDDLEAQARQLGLDDRVHFPGYFQDVTPLYYLFDVYVISSQQESMTYVGMQALALGCPVLATDCGGIRELLDNGRCGIIVPVNDSTALREGMLTLATHPQMRSRFAELGRERFEKYFTEDRMISNLEAILQGQPQPYPVPVQF